MRNKNRNFGWVADKFINLFLIICVVVFAWILLQITSIATFNIPSDSMNPALLAGDNILVNKWVMGGRWFNITDAIAGKEVNIYRLPGLGKVKRNDILVFNFPYPTRWDSIGFDLMTYYVKRCVALPGDTFEIDRAHYRVRGWSGALGNVTSQKNLMSIVERGTEKDNNIVMGGYPNSVAFGWNIVNFGPLYIPAIGDKLEMNTKLAVLYKSVIEWEQKKKLSIRGDMVLLNDSVIHIYEMKENYYFVVGDKVINSKDSRYWGLLPESLIVGKAVRIWKSVDRDTNKLRWSRVLKKIE